MVTNSNNPGSGNSNLRRIKEWKENLLDLSFRNRLLNFKVTKRSIFIETSDIALLEDSLAAGEKFSFLSKSEELIKLFPQKSSDEITISINSPENYANDLKTAQNSNTLLVPHTAKELENRLKVIYREAKINLEEGGANTLFLGLGFLYWYEDENSDVKRVSPIVLLPVQLKRKSARERFKLSHRDEDPLVNVTLIEKLKKDFGVDLSQFSDPPRDENGVDVPSIINGFKKAISMLKRWEVTHESSLGIFSFNKFLMWRDLEQFSEELLLNKIVNHLAQNERGPFPYDSNFPNPSELDKSLPPDSVFCPLDSDSSQLAAILAASQGKTFILEGPPGTGKSQTITNLITHCLGTGKRVLFVSEKMAALEVVKKRLEKVGMGRFSLELHSNKIRKRVVLDELGRSMAKESVTPPSDWGKITNEVSKKRERLNNYVDVIHEKRGMGISYFTAVSQLIALKDIPKIQIDFGADINHVTEEDFGKYYDKVKEISSKALALPSVSEHPLREFGYFEWSMKKNDEISSTVKSYLDSLNEVKTGLPLVLQFLKIEQVKPVGENELDLIGELSGVLGSTTGVSSSIIESQNFGELRDSLTNWVENDKLIHRLSEKHFSRYNEDILELNIESLGQKVHRWAGAFFIFAFFALFFTRFKLRKYCKNSKLPKNNELDEDLSELLTLKKTKVMVDENTPLVESAFRDLPAKHQELWNTIRQKLDWTDNFIKSRAKLYTLSSGLRFNDDFIDFLDLLVISDDDSPPVIAPKSTLLRDFANSVTKMGEIRRELITLGSMDSETFDIPSEYFDFSEKMATRWYSSMASLREWSLFLAANHDANELGLNNLTTPLLNGKLSPQFFTKAFERAFYSWFVEKISQSIPELARFQGSDQDRIITEFKNSDMRLLSLSKEFTVAKLSETASTIRHDGSLSSEPGILISQIKRKRGNMALRTLFMKIRNLLLRLKPCFLMSPLSVAQYLDPAFPDFDVVVFDEASQIPVHDAIGAIARGTQLVVVGDSKQLPPTSFFSNSGSEPDYDAPEENTKALESILAECDAAGLMKMNLKWHYRSRHEDLIAFSNYNYYENSLYTFPAKGERNNQFGVEFRHVKDSFYDQGKSRTNKGEALEVVKEVVSRLLDPDNQKRSIGIVTFSMAQQRLIEDLLDDERRKNPEIEVYFGESVSEPVFIKNLENVQGDERDVMLFSICYGPDQNGNVSINFGPINKEGGERRLNVAITRAREKMIVFSTLLKDHINLSSSNSRGVHDLKMFLDYAQRGSEVLINSTGTLGLAESPFEEDVAIALRNRGWEIHHQVGCSKYRIDLGVVDPDLPGNYILGVECDGATYHSAKTARDRDRLRGQVLEGLGWQLHRIWSTDWWINPENEIAKLEKAIEIALREKKLYTPSCTNSVISKPMGDVGTDTVTGKISGAIPQDREWINTLEVEIEKIGNPYPYYEIKSLRGDAKTLHDPVYASVIRKEIIPLIELEAPVHEKVVAKRICDVLEISRITKKVLERCEEIILSGVNSPVKKGDFWWKKEQDSANWSEIRFPSGDFQRNIDEIPLEELENAINEILSRSLSMLVTELQKRCAKVFGINRMGQRVAKAVDEAIQRTIEKGIAKKENDRIYYKE